jgi:hypothetical protein
MGETTATKTEEAIDAVDGVQLLRSYLLHCRYVRRGLRRIERALSERAEAHDDSKLMADEFAGFTRINKAARLNPYGSPEYRAGLKQEKPTIDLHYSRNRHHPEHAKLAGEAAETKRGLPDDATYWAARTAAEMDFLDLIEMVCDWRGAYLGYGSQGTWEENMVRQRERYKDRFSAGQWWLIDEVAAFVAGVR